MASKKKEIMLGKKTFVKDPTEVEVYLKQQIGQLDAHKNKMLEKISQLYDMNQEGFALRQALNKRNEEIFETKSLVSDLQFALIQQQDQNLSLLKENDQLRLRLIDYQKKVQILMAYANIPDDFPILTLVTSTDPNSVVVERKLPRKKDIKTESHKHGTRNNPNQPSLCRCTTHQGTDPSQYPICSKCGKYIQTETPRLDSDEEICMQKSCKHASAKRLTQLSYSSEPGIKRQAGNIASNTSLLEHINDIDQANLIIESLRSELNEIKYNYDKHIDLLVQDMKLQREEHKSHLDNYSDDCDYYNTYVKNLHQVLYTYLYEDMCSQHKDTSYLGDLYKYAMCVHKCRQLLGDKFPQCIKQYLDYSPEADKVQADTSAKLDQLLKLVQKLQQKNVQVELTLSSHKIRQQENLLNMNQRVELYQRKHDEMLERKNKECKVYRKQIDELTRELSAMKCPT